jgi:hypothetical protein
MNISNYSRLFLMLFLLLINNAIIRGQNTRSTEGTNVTSSSVDKLNGDSLPQKSFKPFVRVGIDMASIARSFFEPEARQFEFSVDSEVWYNWFAVIEGGGMKVFADREQFSYKADGFFLRTGMDYNLLSREGMNKNDLLLVGARYSFSSLIHEASDFFVPNAYWGDYTGSLDPTSYQLHFLELHGGVRTEIFRNIYLGWSIKMRIKIAEATSSFLNPYYIGGYGHGKRRAPLMAHFSLLYKIGL